MNSSNWERVSLGDAGTWLSGGTPLTSEQSYWGGNLPWISAKSLTGFHLRDSDRRLTQLGAQSGTKVVEKNAILMVVRGMSLKTEFRMGIAMRKLAFSQDCKALIARPGIDSLFLAYALKDRTQDILDMVDEAGHGTGRLQTDLLYALEIAVPNLDEQRGISATLGALDDKIESNRRVMELEFLLAINVLTAGSTESVRVGEVATMTKGLSYKGSGLDDGTTPGAVEMVNLANFTTSGQMKSESIKHYIGDFKPAHRLSELDLIVANTDLTQDREILGRGFLIPPRHSGAIHTHHTSVVRFQDGKQWMTPFLWACLQSPDFRDRAKGFATGTTVTALPVETLLDFEFTVPLDPETISAKGNALIRHAWQLKDETECLSRTRDALIPELLSGRVRVPEAEEAVAEVVA